jgi:hypothetical protein
MEVQRLNVEEFLLGHPLANDSRTIETFTDLSGLSLLASLTLQVSGCEVDAYRQGVVIAVGEALWDALAQSADAHYHLSLVVNTSQMVRDKEWLTLIQYCRISLSKYHRLIRTFQRPMQFLVMCGIVHANCKYLHTAAKVLQIERKTK